MRLASALEADKVWSIEEATAQYTDETRTSPSWASKIGSATPVTVNLFSFRTKVSQHQTWRNRKTRLQLPENLLPECLNSFCPLR